MPRTLCSVLVLAGLALSGCYTYGPVDLHVTDAVTGKPIPGLPVQAMYPQVLDFFHPRRDAATTDANGNVRLIVCSNHTPMVDFDFDAYKDEYLLDNPEPTGGLSVPADRFAESIGPPYRLEVKLLTWPEYRQRYPDTTQPSAER